MSNFGGNPNDELSFYKIVLDPRMEELRVPSTLVNRMREETMGEVLLKCGDGDKYWNITTREDGNSMYFHGGWKEFALENHIQMTQVLFFNYDGAKTFTVRIFDKNGLEK
uniref:TF-B3 domain-containing protein n=1 Tax=Solanum lycopersicum TaxID=4081 RepID=A0A3Q7F0Z8_SOLLC|nr:B3 domain-containing protein Os11g0197600-like [Solanum lycopersicum]